MQGLVIHSVGVPNLGGNLTKPLLHSIHELVSLFKHDLQLLKQGQHVLSGALYFPTSQSFTIHDPIIPSVGGHLTLPNVFAAHL